MSKLPASILRFDTLLNEPPPFEDETRVREYRHQMYPRWREVLADITKLFDALEPFTRLGGPDDGVMPAYHDLEDDVVIYKNSGQCITAGDVRAARNAFGILHAPKRAVRAVR